MTNKIVIANWKLNGSTTLLQDLLKPIINFVNSNKILSTIIIAPPIIYLYQAYSMIMNTNIMIGAQNVDIHLNGAFTGEISVDMLKDVNARYVLVGHSERRLYHHEHDLFIAKKFKIVKDAKLIPILCIGETQKDYHAGMTKMICKKQIDSIFNLLGEQAFYNTIIAYEPVWAIGSGMIPKFDFIKDIFCFIKNYVLKKQNLNKKLFSIQYGGSVDENNIKKLCKIVEIDGFLVGSAALSLNRFLKILTITSKYCTNF
ncbi:MAG: triose-phosphate isomerase [Buchnera aphidicola (Meitanaphis microgallis)]